MLRRNKVPGPGKEMRSTLYLHLPLRTRLHAAPRSARAGFLLKILPSPAVETERPFLRQTAR